MKWLVKVVRTYEDQVDEAGNDIKVEVGQPSYIPLLKTSSLAKPRGIESILIDGVQDITPDEGVVEMVDGELYVSRNLAIAELKAEYKQMDDGIVLDAAPIFKTTNRESMLAFVDSFQLRIMLPEPFVGERAQIEIGEFLVGDILDTPDKVKDYYGKILLDLDEKRNLRISEYLLRKQELGL